MLIILASSQVAAAAAGCERVTTGASNAPAEVAAIAASIERRER